ncbi:glutamate--tRNA ligase [Urbifossiella limnaea]|uniref:Glutamate--tRNA ligase n=1 Tax=Urbifossiella limnaea TaxID=2528023 RepID=A0A517XMP8_9BACT|nr:glutamate--tRNA ligase family protein [Urbifossiella limnaea]QDU18790.1 Glutamate--tRNA ligase 1 [Urbifossiella limnaea]
MTIRTRFAPSPTGYLHIGGVRTALFNWLYARRHGGQFVLRIDDTDAARNRAEAVKPILDGFDWLGLDWDEGPTKDASGNSVGPHAPYFQSQRNDRYVAAALQLIETGHAYPDYTTPDEQDARRKAAEKAKRAYVHRGSNRDVDPAENLRLYREKPAAVLLKVPEGRAVVFKDHVRGEVKVETSTIRDPALLRAPDAAGVCRALYSFATVVDEVAFGITHVVRAEEHLTNTPTQLLIFEALGATPPEFAHIPLVNYNNKKMSKRDLPPLSAQETAALKACGWTDEALKGRDDLNIATVAYYRELGYLPEAVINYLVRLGWSLDATSEFIPLDTILKNFDLDRITKAAANFDTKKLYWLQGEYMKLVPVADKVERCLPYLRRAGLVGETVPDAVRARLTQVAEAAGDRVKLFSDMVQFAGPLLRTDPVYDPAAVEKAMKPNAELLRAYRDALAAAEPFDAVTTAAALQAVAPEKDKHKALVAATRVAVTGVTVGFGLYETLAILGKAEALRRVDLGLKQVS